MKHEHQARSSHRAPGTLSLRCPQAAAAPSFTARSHSAAPSLTARGLATGSHSAAPSLTARGLAVGGLAVGSLAVCGLVACGARSSIDENAASALAGSGGAGAASTGGSGGAGASGGTGGSGGTPFVPCSAFEWAGPAVPLAATAGFYRSLAMAAPTGAPEQICVGTRTAGPDDPSPREGIGCLTPWGSWPPPDLPAIVPLLPVPSLSQVIAPATNKGIAKLFDVTPGGVYFLDDRAPLDDTPPLGEPFFTAGLSRPLFLRKQGNWHLLGVAEEAPGGERVFLAGRGDGTGLLLPNMGCAQLGASADGLLLGETYYWAVSTAQVAPDCSVQPAEPPFVVNLYRMTFGGEPVLLSTTGGAGYVHAVRLLPASAQSLWVAIRYETTFTLSVYDEDGLAIGGFPGVLHNGPRDVAVEAYGEDVLVAHVDVSDPDLAGDIFVELYRNGDEQPLTIAGFDTAEYPFSHNLALAVSEDGRHVLLAWTAKTEAGDLPVVRRLDCAF